MKWEILSVFINEWKLAQRKDNFISCYLVFTQSNDFALYYKARKEKMHHPDKFVDAVIWKKFIWFAK